MSTLPDRGTLDALILGASEPEDDAAWEALVRHPGGERAWNDALARRRRMDLVASAIRGRPWLARAVQRLRTLGRTRKHTPGTELSFLFLDAELDDLASATLGPAEDQWDATPLQPEWGRVVSIRVRVGAAVSLQLSAGSEVVDVRYVCNGSEGNLPSRTWRLEPGESPVLLVALAGTSPELALDEAMTRSTGMWGMLLLEDDSKHT